MAINLIEEDRLVYHGRDGDTFQVRCFEDELGLECIETLGEVGVLVNANHGAVETLRNALTCWLETGKLTK